jgi:hypothetical protein
MCIIPTGSAVCRPDRRWYTRSRIYICVIQWLPDYISVVAPTAEVIESGVVREPLAGAGTHGLSVWRSPDSCE